MQIKQKLKEYKKELVLQKAGEYLEKNGFENIKMADVAKYCGISVGALYKLFDSKDELFYSYVTQQIDIVYEKLQDRFCKLSSHEDRIKEFIKIKFETFLEKKILLADTTAGDPLFFIKLNKTKQNPAKKIYELIEKEFESFSKSHELKIDDFQKIAYLFSSFLYGYIEFWLCSGHDISDYVDEAYDIFISGIKR